MNLYTIPQCPELLLQVTSKESRKARYQVLRKIIELIKIGELSISLTEGFSTRQIIEIAEGDLMANSEDNINTAVKTLSKLAEAKRKMQELHETATEIRKLIDPLFDINHKLSNEQYQKLKTDLKILQDYAKAYLRYKEALVSAEEARLVLDRALESK